MWRFVLVSSSPRRRELFRRLIPVFEVVAPEVDEYVEASSPEELVKELALKKLSSVAVEDGTFYVAADTVVVLGDRVMGKPKDESHAVSMLLELSGRVHRVLTGVAAAKDGDVVCEVEETLVRFHPITGDEALWYVETYRPLDKAGAYGIQDGAELFVESVEGSYSNVVGLPLSLTYRMLKRLGYRPTRWVRLGDVARVVRSKNAGPFEVTFDVMFGDWESYRRFKEGDFLTPEVFARLYGIPVEDVLVFEYFDQAMALKITVKRQVPSGSIGDEDVYAAQQHLPLFNFMIPWKVYG